MSLASLMVLPELNAIALYLATAEQA